MDEIFQAQLKITTQLQHLLLKELKHPGLASEGFARVAKYLSLIEESIGLLMSIDDSTLSAAMLGKIVSEILGVDYMTIDETRFQQALLAVSSLQLNAKEDEANRQALTQAQADLQAAKDEVTKLESELADLQADDTADKQAVVDAEAKLAAATEEVTKAENAANQLIDALVPTTEVPPTPTTDVPNEPV